MLATGGMVAWITAWATGVLHADAGADPTTAARTDSSTQAGSGPAPHHDEGPEPAACVSFPPAVATQVVRVLSQLTLPHTRLPIHEQEAVPP